MSKKAIYAIYKGDKFIDVGTLEELSERNNMKKRTIQFKTSPTYQKRIKNKGEELIVIRLKEEEEDD